MLDEFISYCVEHNFYGLENLSAIPGTVGAGPVQNIGAYGVEVKDLIKNVDTINLNTGETKRFTRKECKFTYRGSFFKTKDGSKYVITNVCFKLKKQSDIDTSYNDVSRYFKENKTPSLYQVREAIINIRKNKFPDLNRVGTAGSFFKNIVATNAKYTELLGLFGEVPSYKVNREYEKVPLGFILEKLGWKEKNTNKYLCIKNKH